MPYGDILYDNRGAIATITRVTPAKIGFGVNDASPERSRSNAS